MFEISSTSEVMELVSNYKNKNEGKKIETNFFGFKDDEVILKVIKSNHGVFFIEKNLLQDIDTYYYYSTFDGFEDVKFKLPNSNIIKSEYIFRYEASDLVLRHFSNIGFEKYAVLNKMYCLSSKINYSLDKRVTVCTYQDLSYLRGIFDNYFDKISERPPLNDEILNALNVQSIYKIVENSKFLGFYWADSKKFTSELRYVFLDQAERGRGLGEVLLVHYLGNSNNIRKKQLWVLKDNIIAINLYKKYGFIDDAQKDYIFMVRK